MKLIDFLNLYSNKDKTRFTINYHNENVYISETIENIIESEKDLLKLSLLEKNIDHIAYDNIIYIKEN